MTWYKNIGFQPYDPNLSARLKALLQQDSGANPNCPICLPDAFRTTHNMRSGSALFWFFHKSFYFKYYEALLNKQYQYGNTPVTRPYHDYKGKQLSRTIFDKFKQLYQSRRVLIVEGSGDAEAVTESVVIPLPYVSITHHNAAWDSPSTGSDCTALMRRRLISGIS